MSLLSNRQLVVASHLAQFVIPLPELKPTARYAAGTPIRLDTFYSSGAWEVKAFGAFRLPIFLPLSWEDGRPKEVAIWLGNPLHVVSTRPQHPPQLASSSQKPTIFRLMETGLNTAMALERCAAGTTIGLANREAFARTLVVTPSGASDCGLVRLDRVHSTLIAEGAFRWPLDEGERVARMSIDEEASCLVLLKYNKLPEGSFSWKISIYNLH
jgi:hypothetical protein